MSTEFKLCKYFGLIKEQRKGFESNGFICRAAERMLSLRSLT